jgi:hypothetical protein
LGVLGARASKKWDCGDQRNIGHRRALVSEILSCCARDRGKSPTRKKSSDYKMKASRVVLTT